MAYTDEAVLAKLSALNESHDSIATAAQWIMFHKRHADRTVQLWHQRLKESPSSKRLNLIYLANEVTQQLKARQKQDFVIAFSPIIADATATAYKGATQDVQGKIRRVADVWRDRKIFETPIQDAIEARMDEMDKARGTTRVAAGATTSNLSSVPSDLAPLVLPTQTVSKLQITTSTAVTNAAADYDKLNDPKLATPSAPVYAARLNGLLKTLATAEGAVAQCVKARTDLVKGLQKLLDTNRASLEKEEKQLEELRERKTATDNKKKDVEAAIMRGLIDQDSALTSGPIMSPGMELDRPEVEALTPPATEIEPVLIRPEYIEPDETKVVSASPTGALPPNLTPATNTQSGTHTAVPALDILSNMPSHYQSGSGASNGANKRRRVDSDDDFAALDNDGIDPNIDAMIRT